MQRNGRNIRSTKRVFDNGPSALDVYRGNTTLKIMSVNGVPQDTVVVFKK